MVKIPLENKSSLEMKESFLLHFIIQSHIDHVKRHVTGHGHVHILYTGVIHLKQEQCNYFHI